jgi:hypothetical protein
LNAGAGTSVLIVTFADGWSAIPCTTRRWIVAGSKSITFPRRRYSDRSSLSPSGIGGIGTRSARDAWARSRRRSRASVLRVRRPSARSRRSSARRLRAAVSRRPSASASALR